MKPQTRSMLELLANHEMVQLYKIPPSIRQYNARIWELRNLHGWDIPDPVVKKNHKGTLTSTYSMPAEERKRALKFLGGS